MKNSQHMLKKLKRKENRHLYYILIWPAFLIAFFSLEHFEAAEYWVSYLPLDDKIPFCEYFILPYVMWYPYLAATGLLLLVKDHEGFKKYMRVIGLGFGISLLFCAVFPNGQELRPETFPRDNFCSWLLGLIYAADNNQNVLPSTHVVGSFAAAAAFCFSPAVKKRAVKIGWAALALLISSSTVLVKQHSVLDIFAALPLTALLLLCIYRPWHKNARNLQTAGSPENQH